MYIFLKKLKSAECYVQKTLRKKKIPKNNNTEFFSPPPPPLPSPKKKNITEVHTLSLSLFFPYPSLINGKRAREIEEAKKK